MFSTAIRKVAKLDILNILNINIIVEVSLNISKSAKCQKHFIFEGSNSTFTLQIIKTVFHANFSTNPQWRRWFWGTLWYFLKILEWQLWKCQVRTVWNIWGTFLTHPSYNPWRKKWDILIEEKFVNFQKRKVSPSYFSVTNSKYPRCWSLWEPLTWTFINTEILYTWNCKTGVFKSLQFLQTTNVKLLSLQRSLFMWFIGVKGTFQSVFCRLDLFFHSSNSWHSFELSNWQGSVSSRILSRNENAAFKYSLSFVRKRCSILPMKNEKKLPSFTMSWYLWGMMVKGKWWLDDESLTIYLVVVK